METNNYYLKNYCEAIVAGDSHEKAITELCNAFSEEPISDMFYLLSQLDTKFEISLYDMWVELTFEKGCLPKVRPM